jgi:uncharacterized protein YaaN involved in tellurite resistance
LTAAQVDDVLEQAQKAVAEAQEAAPAAAEGIKLTLGAVEPTPPEVAKAIAEPAKAVPDADEVRDKFTPEEEAMIRDFSKKIDVTDANLVFAYGASAQQQIASFSDSALKNVKTKDLGEVGDMIAGLVTELKGFTIDEKEGGFFAFFKRNIDKLTMLKNRYDEAEVNVGKIVSGLESHQVQLLKDIATLDQLYSENLRYFKELSMYIAAGKLRLKEFRANELEASARRRRPPAFRRTPRPPTTWPPRRTASKRRSTTWS